MSKSIYSLVLSDELMEVIDRAAYKSGTSRSNMVNMILSEHFSLTTPEKKNRIIFSGIESILSQSSAILTERIEPVMLLRSALAYKYNPSLRYSVELFSDGNKENGRLTVSVRSQNGTLLSYMADFFAIWEGVERAHGVTARSEFDGSRYVRLLRIGNNENDLQTKIALFIRAFDGAIKVFFSHLGDSEKMLIDSVNTVYTQIIVDNKVTV